MTERTHSRVFFAAVPDPDTRALIAAAATAIDPATPVYPHDYHLTLAFVGDVAQALLALLRQIGASQRGSPFSLRFDRYEYWPRPRVLVLAASAVPASLQSLWHALHAELAAQPLAPALAPQDLRPHVTIARKVSQAPVLPALSAFTWTPRAFHLMQTSISGATPRYTVVDTWALLDESGAS